LRLNRVLSALKDEYAVIAELDFLGLPGGFVAVVGVLPAALRDLRRSNCAHDTDPVSNGGA